MARKRSARANRLAEAPPKRQRGSKKTEVELRRLMAETENAIEERERDQQVTQELLELEVSI